MFEWVLNTPLRTFLFPFHYSFLVNISNRSGISSSMYMGVIFIAKKNFYIKASILS